MYPIHHIDLKTTWDQWVKAHPEIILKKRKIILRQGQSPGDILTFTRVVGDLKESYPNYQIDVRTPCAEIWENNPRLTPLKEEDKEVEIFTIGYDEINQSGWEGLHFSDAFRHDVEKRLGIPIKKTGIRPELFISEEERSWWNQVHCEFKWDGPFWILNAGRKPDNELKQYHRWQEVVDLFNERFQNRVKLVQVGHKDHIHPKLKGVLNLVGKTDTRQFIRLMYWAHGSVGPISFQMVLSAAFEQPSVCIAGGKEGVRWHVYPHMRWLDTNGCIDCCKWDGCWLGGEGKKCKHLIDKVPLCFRLISPEQIVDAIEMYYKGGALKITDTSQKPVIPGKGGWFKRRFK
ncbi:ADP-heptose--LPS heptosyltransferase [candidate division WOR-3 bacterium]|nr:ADP-heptose--LPS heptosyltransferase [candidate division WOR-3 bacterium]